MMAAWSPGVRDNGVRGVVALLARPEWSHSDAAAELRASVAEALHDQNPLVRMMAADGVITTYPDSDWAERAAAVGGLLLKEQDEAVRRVLLGELGRCANGAPRIVDEVLERLIDGESFHGDVTRPGAERDDVGISQVVSLATYLAMVQRTPFASEAVGRWCAASPDEAAKVRFIAQSARNLLRPGNHAGQEEAFRLLGIAATAAAQVWETAVSVPGAPGVSERQRAQLRGALKVTHEIAQQLFFASGAHDARTGNGGEGCERRNIAAMGRSEGLSAFADRALPLLNTCAKVPEPSGVHYAAQTAIFLAPLDELRSLRFIADSVSVHVEYTADALAGGTVLPYLERLVADQRALVLHDQVGVDAFRQALEAFAGAGNEAALRLAYTFSEVFR